MQAAPSGRGLLMAYNNPRAPLRSALGYVLTGLSARRQNNGLRD